SSSAWPLRSAARRSESVCMSRRANLYSRAQPRARRYCQRLISLRLRRKRTHSVPEFTVSSVRSMSKKATVIGSKKRTLQELHVQVRRGVHEGAGGDRAGRRAHPSEEQAGEEGRQPARVEIDEHVAEREQRRRGEQGAPEAAAEDPVARRPRLLE